MKRSLNLLPFGLVLGALALAGCGSDGESVSVENSWARTSAAGQTNGAVYFDLTVDEDDTLLGASVPASIAADAQVHEVVIADMDDSAATAGSESMDDMDCEEIVAEHMEMSDEDMADMDDADQMSEIDDMDCEEIRAEHAEMSDEHMDDMDDMDDMDSGEMGAMTMQELIDGLVFTAGETLGFEPGSYHVMLLDIVEPLEVGDEVEVTLEFAER